MELEQRPFDAKLLTDAFELNLLSEAWWEKKQVMVREAESDLICNVLRFQNKSSQASPGILLQPSLTTAVIRSRCLCSQKLI